MVGRLVVWLAVGWLATSTNRASASGERQKRLIWVTSDGRLALPPGTLLTVTPTISLPFVRYPPDGFLSNMTVSLPFTINFDSLGLTDNQNPYGALPPLLARSMGRGAGALVADYIASLVHRRHARAPKPPDPPPSHLHGGERALLYILIEDFLSNFGLNGRACMLRAICEVHGYSLKRFGFVGEVLKLFFTASKSPYADIIKDHVEAEERGSTGGECFPYFKECPKSLFLPPEKNKYMKDEESGDKEDLVRLHSVEDMASPEVTLNDNILENKVM